MGGLRKMALSIAVSVIVLLAACTSGSGQAPSGGPANEHEVTVGSFDFAESRMLAELYSQALVGMVALVGQWWLDNRSLDKHAVAAHLVNLSYNGLAHLDPQPALVDRPASG